MPQSSVEKKMEFRGVALGAIEMVVIMVTRFLADTEPSKLTFSSLRSLRDENHECNAVTGIYYFC